MSIQIRETSPPPRRSTRGKLLVFLVALVVLVGLGVILVTVVGNQADDSESSSETESGDDATTGPTNAPDDETAEAQKSGIPLGDATAGLSRSSKQVGQAARGFPRSLAGAVEAATAIRARLARSALLPEAANRAFVTDAFPGAPYDDAASSIADSQQAIGATPTGSVPNLPVGDRYYADCLPAYGAYKVEGSLDDQVIRVGMWMPCIYGPGSPSDVEDLRVDWKPAVADMSWQDGDWRTSWSGFATRDDKAAVPDDPNRPDVSFDERAKMMDTGWELYADASEDWPTELLGPSPEEYE